MDLELINIHYLIKNKKILSNINLSFSCGIYALLGLNGAGKTSLLNIITTLAEPSSGRIDYLNKPIRINPLLIRRDLGFMSQNIGLIQDFTVEQNLFYFGLLKGCNNKDLKSKIKESLEYFGLTAEQNIKVQNLSGGTKQRIGIALSMINNPKILVLDEPINNLDKYEREKLYFILQRLSKNCIVIISTHLIDEIESFSDEVIFIRNGEVVFKGNVQDSITNIPSYVNEKTINNTNLVEINSKYKIIKYNNENNGLKIRYFTEEQTLIKTVFEDAFAYYTKFI